MGLEFEEAFDNLDKNVNRICIKFLEKIGVNDGKIHKEVVGQKGDNHVARVRRFVVQHENIEKPIKMIVKIAPTDETLRNMIKVVQMFNNEALIYDKLLPKYKEFEDSAHVLKEDRLNSAVCYGIYLEAPPECIALEDLNEHGFALVDRLKYRTDEEVKLVINDLAKFHALGFVFKEYEKSLFEEIKMGLTDVWAYNDENETLKIMLDFITRQVEFVLDEDDYIVRVKNILGSSLAIAKAVHMSAMSSEHAIVIQGDCWTNNFLFKRKNGKPIEVIMLDYQLARISSPIVDLNYMIFSCTDSETRSKYYYEWLDFYYDNFTKYLAYHDLKSSHVYPRDKFNEDLRMYAENSLVLALFAATMLVRENEDVVNFKEDGIDSTSMDNEVQKFGISSMKDDTFRRYKERVNGVVKDFILYGYI